MAFIKRLNMQTELGRLAHGKKAHIPTEIICDWALTQVRGGLPAPAHSDELKWLERLYRLEDRRG
jgi:hypothetical protein